MTVVDLRALGPDDWQTYRDLRLAALAADPDAFLRTVEEEAAYDESVWRTRLGSGTSRTWLASPPSGPPAGMATAVPGRPTADAAELVGLWVAPAARGQGVARQLAVEALGWVHRRGCARLTLWVADDNVAARRLYDGLGFEPTGATGAFPPPRAHITEHEQVLKLGDPARVGTT